MNLSYEIIGWLVAFLALLLIESVTMQLVSVWFAAGALAGLILSAIGAPFWAQLLVFVLYSITVLLLFRPALSKAFKGRFQPTNLELDVGRVAMVTETIDNNAGKGRVELSGVYWSARSVDEELLEVGTPVVVREVHGTTLLVSGKLAHIGTCLTEQEDDIGKEA